MRKVILLGIFAFAVACKSESDVDPATGSFIRYYGSEKNHTAVQALEINDGFTMLANVEIPIEGTTTVGYKIKLIRTDLNGNQQWEKSYPEFVEGNNASISLNNMTATAFITLANSGYLIIGDRIKTDQSTDLLLLHLDQEGTMLDSTTISGADIGLPGASLRGTAVMENASSAYTILGKIDWPSTTTPTTADDMFVGELDLQTYSLSWKRQYGAGSATLVNKIFTTPDNNLFWGGSVLSYGQHDIRLVKVPRNTQLPAIGSPLQTINEELAYDICAAPGGYLITGSTNDGGDEDIFLMKVNASADLVFYNRFASSPGESSGDDLNDGLDFGLNDRGNSIAQSADGSFVMLATVESDVTQEDMYIIKINPVSGNVIWKNSFGGADREDGASVTATSDGSFVLFGTSYFGRVKKLMLIKVNKDGQL